MAGSGGAQGPLSRDRRTTPYLGGVQLWRPPMYAPHMPFATQHDGGPRSQERLPLLDEVEVARVARTNASVLFTGPVHVRTLALEIHSLSGWRWGPFLAIDCTAPEEVIDQQLLALLENDLTP